MAVLVGKKNLEVRPLAVNKGEIVRRLMYENPDADFVFCAGDDKVRFCSGEKAHQLNHRPMRTCSAHSARYTP